MVDEGKGS